MASTQMQRPTLENTHIATVRDAYHIFYAVARQGLPMITRRLDAEERRHIRPGNVYVWEEHQAAGDASGQAFERWTDGMSWGPSRVRDEFLYYQVRGYEADNEPSSSSWGPPSILRRGDSSTRSSGRSAAGLSASGRLTKQTYSVLVSLPQDRPRGIERKWHFTAYYCEDTVDHLTPVSAIPGVGDVPVPEGIFKSGRHQKNRRGEPFIMSPLPPLPLSDVGMGMANLPSSPHSVPRQMSAAPQMPYGIVSAGTAFGFAQPHPSALSMPRGRSYTLSTHLVPSPSGSFTHDPSSCPMTFSTAAFDYSPQSHSTNYTYYRDGSGYHDIDISPASTPSQSSNSSGCGSPRGRNRSLPTPTSSARMDGPQMKPRSSSASTQGSSLAFPQTPVGGGVLDDGNERTPGIQIQMPASGGSDAEAHALVPLEYLDNSSCPPRDPADQELLRRFPLLGQPGNCDM